MWPGGIGGAARDAPPPRPSTSAAPRAAHGEASPRPSSVAASSRRGSSSLGSRRGALARSSPSFPGAATAAFEQPPSGDDTPSILNTSLFSSPSGNTSTRVPLSKIPWASRSFFDYQRIGRKRVKALSAAEHQDLEGAWYGGHHVSFSQMNGQLTANCRDYFDRPREWQVGKPHVTVPVPVRPTWSLTSDPLHRLSKESRQGDRTGASRSTGARKLAWTNRHHVTVSKDNTVLSMAEREYFSQYMPPQAGRLIPRKMPGMTKAILPNHHPHDPDGCDDAGRSLLDVDPEELVEAMVPHLVHFVSAPPAGEASQAHG